MKHEMQLPKTFVKEDYALFISKEKHLLIEYSFEKHKYILFKNYETRPDESWNDTPIWEKLVRMKEYDSMNDIIKELDGDEE